MIKKSYIQGVPKLLYIKYNEPKKRETTKIQFAPDYDIQYI